MHPFPVSVSGLLLEVAAQLAPRSAEPAQRCSPLLPSVRSCLNEPHCLIPVENPSKRVSLTEGMRRL